MQRCVDDTNTVVSEQFCSSGFVSRYHWGADPATGQRRCLDFNNIPVNDLACTSTLGRHYHWYYGGHGSYTPGSVATEGSEFPRSGARYATASGATSGDSGRSASRGGFGHSGGAGRGA